MITKNKDMNNYIDHDRGFAKTMVAKQGADQIPTATPIQSEYEKVLQNQADEVGKTLDLNRGSLALDGYQNFAIDVAELIRKIRLGEQGYMDEQTRIANERPGREG